MGQGRACQPQVLCVRRGAHSPWCHGWCKCLWQARGVSVHSEGRIGASVIDKEQLIDRHYGSIANRAVRLHPSERIVSADARNEFETMFSKTWAHVLEQGLAFNALGAAKRLGLDGPGLETAWRKLERGKDLLKFGGGPRGRGRGGRRSEAGGGRNGRGRCS